MTKAKVLLSALRQKHRADAVVREVVIDDPFEAAVRRRDAIERARGWGPGHAERRQADYETRGLPIADRVPESWTFRDSIPQRRIDALIFASTGITAVEIKVSRADFRRDTDEKRRAWRSVTNRFIYLTPAGLIRREEVPEGCGLWEFDDQGLDTRYPWRHGIRSVVRATVNKNPDPLPFQVTRALAHRVSNVERKVS
ncbi:hypothetical protein [Microbacterium enclense]|uniref:hypothetical protein n=1 Tax=Microbacterium enclense TaxID=993073 RepID=UPI003F80B17F